MQGHGCHQLARTVSERGIHGEPNPVTELPFYAIVAGGALRLTTSCGALATDMARCLMSHS